MKITRIYTEYGSQWPSGLADHFVAWATGCWFESRSVLTWAGWVHSLPRLPQISHQYTFSKPFVEQMVGTT